MSMCDLCETIPVKAQGDLCRKCSMELANPAAAIAKAHAGTLADAISAQLANLNEVRVEHSLTKPQDAILVRLASHAIARMTEQYGREMFKAGQAWETS